MATLSSEESPLLAPSLSVSRQQDEESTPASIPDNKAINANYNVQVTTATPIKSRVIFKGIQNGLENFLDWSPFIAVQSMIGSESPEYAFKVGTYAAAFVILHSFLKHTRCTTSTCRPKEEDEEKGESVDANSIPFRPKVLDVGQLVLFGMLYLLTILLQSSWQNAGMYLLVWFNPITTGGMGCIMYFSILCGRPFVYDYAQAGLPPHVWDILIPKRWFQDALTESAIFWVKIMTAMTATVTIQPLLVTLFYDGDANNDYSGWMTFLGSLLTVCQFIILFYGFYESHRMGTRQQRNKKRVRERMQNGLTEKERHLYGNDGVDINVKKSNHRIVSLGTGCRRDGEDLKGAAKVLTDAFEGNEVFGGYLDTAEGLYSFFHANLKSIADFHQVFACLSSEDEDEPPSHKPKCIMACIPVLSKSQEELEIFNSFDAWIQHGFEIPGATETDFPVPDDDMMELGQMKFKSVHGLRKKPYMLVAWFGADSNYRGMGYGRTLLHYVIGISEARKLPLVLETTSAWNRTNYEKYGFQVVDHVKGRPDWVLMVRPVGQSKL